MLWSSSPTANTPCASPWSTRPGGANIFSQRVLQPVGVLELVDQHVAEAALVVLAQRVVVAQQLVGAQHQLGEVDHAFALALVFVGLVDLDQLARLLVADLDVARPQAFVLGAGDEPAHLLGHEALFVEVHRLDDALDGATANRCMSRIWKLCGSAGQLPVRAQEAVAQAVEGADPHAAHVHRQHRRQARQHLLGRLVGEGHRQHAAGRDLAGLQQPGDARGQHARLARAGAGQDQRRLRPAASPPPVARGSGCAAACRRGRQRRSTDGSSKDSRHPLLRGFAARPFRRRLD